MNSFLYALLSYGLTALISIGVVGLIVVINNLMGRKPQADTGQEAD